MKSVSTGIGLCVLGAAIALHPVLDRLAPTASASQPAAIAVATPRGPEPTIVWYGVAPCTGDSTYTRLFRAWSDGRVEAMQGGIEWSEGACKFRNGNNPNCGTSWVLVSSPEQGYAAASDLNFDQQVDGADLGQLLASWGDAPRHTIAPSECPLNLINP